VIKIHHIEGRRSERVAWLLEELGQPYELVFKEGEVRASFTDLVKVHPMHMAPTVEDGDLKLIESGAILEYFLRKFGAGGLVPAESSPDYQRYLTYMHFAEGSAMPRLQPHLIAAMTGKPPREGREAQQLKDMLGFLESELTERSYFAGDQFSAADIMMAFPVNLIGRIGEGLKDYPHIKAYLDRIQARPAYKRMMAKALPSGRVPAT
jgi:glutathione S-transferase